MIKKNKIILEEKSNLHPLNKHRARYNFEELCVANSELRRFVSVNKYNNESIDFSNADAVKALNKALLKHFYNITYWDIPANYLCPPIPGRADYIHYMSDLLCASNNNVLPKGDLIKVLDIGTGANCVYPLIGTKEYGWHFVGSDIDATAINSAKQIIEKNSLSNFIECRLQPSSTNIFKGVIKSDEFFDLTVCNPPFHSSAEEARAGSERKWRNLGHKKNEKSILNFGGQHNELWCKGGEKSFINKMIEESAQLPTSCFWYTTLVAKSEHLQGVYDALKKVNAATIKTIEMAQGQKVSRIVAWTFLNSAQQKEWREKSWMKA